MMDRYALAINRALDALPVRGLESMGRWRKRCCNDTGERLKFEVRG